MQDGHNDFLSLTFVWHIDLGQLNSIQYFNTDFTSSRFISAEGGGLLPTELILDEVGHALSMSTKNFGDDSHGDDNDDADDDVDDDDNKDAVGRMQVVMLRAL